MNGRIFNERIYESIETWQKNGDIIYLSILNVILTEHAKSLIYSKGKHHYIYIRKNKYSKQDIITVLDNLKIEYTISSIPLFFEIGV